MGPVASLPAMDRTTLTAALKPLERRGLVRIELGLSDRRSRVLRITDKGRRLMARAVPVWQSTHDAVESLMPQGAADEIRRGLQALS